MDQYFNDINKFTLYLGDIHLLYQKYQKVIVHKNEDEDVEEDAVKKKSQKKILKKLLRIIHPDKVNFLTTNRNQQLFLLNCVKTILSNKVCFHEAMEIIKEDNLIFLIICDKLKIDSSLFNSNSSTQHSTTFDYITYSTIYTSKSINMITIKNICFYCINIIRVWLENYCLKYSLFKLKDDQCCMLFEDKKSKEYQFSISAKSFLSDIINCNQHINSIFILISVKLPNLYDYIIHIEILNYGYGDGLYFFHNFEKLDEAVEKDYLLFENQMREFA
jgi:hypothetical protein